MMHSNNNFLKSSNQIYNQNNSLSQPLNYNNYHQMNLQNNSLNFCYSPTQIQNNVHSNQLPLVSSPNNLERNKNFFSYQNSPSNQINSTTSYTENSKINSSDLKTKKNHSKNNVSELETFNFQNRTHIRGFQNNFEAKLNQSLNDDYIEESKELNDGTSKNKFFSSINSKNQVNNLPISNVHLSITNSAAPRTGSTSPVSSYNSPTITESRTKKNKFNFKMRKFKIKGKKSSTKQSKKLNKSQKSKSKPGLLFFQLNKNILSGNLNSLSKMQLSILNAGLIRIESERASSIITKEPFDLSTNKFIDHLALLRKYNVLFKIEYIVACKNEPHSFRHALRSENEIKNCNKKLLPYDYNRVVLETIPSVPCSDYINASYIDSILKPKAYIATQGPTEETITDFWRMVWEQQSHIIVMLTKVFDFIRVMCDQYWPIDINKAEVYGNIEVTLLTEEPLADFYIRTFKIQKLTDTQISERIKQKKEEKKVKINNDSKEEKKKEDDFFRPITPSYNKLHNKDDDFRIIYQFHYEKWPTHSCPFASSILQFRRRIRIFMKELQGEEKNLGPIVVHCSDGGGRTGAFLAIDANLEFAKEDNMFDIFNYSKKLRQMRKGLIDGIDQYKFVYECLEEAHLSKKTWFPVSDLSVKMKFKSIRDNITKVNEYQREYERILKVTPKFTIGDCAGGHRVENRSKNRDVLTIPPDNHRPYLTTFQTNDSTDFVNAVFVDGYTRSREYIITEWPMAHTISDCWSLIYDHDCNSVVVLANPEDESTFPSFWPVEKHEEKKFGPVFTVECISFNHYANIKCWLIKIHKKVVSLTELMSGVKGVPKMTQLFQITCWPALHKVPSSTNALVELMNMVERWRQRTTYGPVLVISTDGCSRAGIYCAANVAIEQVVQHREVDVFQAVKTVRRHRPFLVENLTEYKYCYDLILTYVINYLKPESPHST